MMARTIYNRIIFKLKRRCKEMGRSIFVRVQWLEALYLCRAIFHEVVFKGGSLSFFQNYKMNIER
ncbi:RAxF-45 family protein [Neobacillus drentensis]|uniref:RAxF-45 family protein n=1 Tax=Neobacillus drentensis TaxID=220684 RepID=UPI00300016F3